MKIFLDTSSIYSCHLFLISSASVRSIKFLSFIMPIFAWNVPLLSLIFLKWSLLFPILLFSSISLHWSLRKALSLLAILWNAAFKWVYLSFSPFLFTALLFTATCKASSDPSQKPKISQTPPFLISHIPKFCALYHLNISSSNPFSLCHSDSLLQKYLLSLIGHLSICLSNFIVLYPVSDLENDWNTTSLLFIPPASLY